MKSRASAGLWVLLAWTGLSSAPFESFLVPESELLSPSGERFRLDRAFAGRPGVLLFYPGGWDPNSVKVLKDLRNQEPELTKLRFQIVGVTPDRPKRILETLEEHDLPFVVLSDEGAQTARKFGVAESVPEKELNRLRAFGLDIHERTDMIDVVVPRLSLFWVEEGGQVVRRDGIKAEELLGVPELLLSRARWLVAQAESRTSDDQ